MIVIDLAQLEFPSLTWQKIPIYAELEIPSLKIQLELEFPSLEGLTVIFIRLFINNCRNMHIAPSAVMKVEFCRTVT